MENKKTPIELLGHRLDYSLRRYFVDCFHAELVSTLRDGSAVLDVGGNKSKKRGQFNIENYNLRVTYVNLSTAKLPDAQSDAAWLPFVRESFDTVICSELLEHVPDPPSVLKEAFRVLRKNGVILICVPFLYQIHGDPYDFGRYTDYYWLNHLSKLGFTNIEIEKQGSFWSVLTDMVRAWLYELDKTGTLRFKKVVVAIMTWAKKMAVQRDTRAESKVHPFFSSFTTGFGIVARK